MIMRRAYSIVTDKIATEFDFGTTQHSLFQIDFETSIMEFLKKLAEVSFVFLRSSKKHQKIVFFTFLLVLFFNFFILLKIF